MPPIELTPAERRTHRANAHHLDPVVMIGGDGLTDAVVREVDHALKSHGLIKVRAMIDDRSAREAILVQLTHQLGAAPVQHIGKLFVLWRPIPPQENLAREGRQPGPRVVKLVKFSKSGNHRAVVKKIKVLGNERIAAGGKIKRVKPRASSVKKKMG